MKGVFKNSCFGLGSKLAQSFENDGFSETDAKELRIELGRVYLDRLQWMSTMKRNPVHRKITKTRDAFVDEDHFDPGEALAAAIKMRKFLLERMIENRQHFPENDDNDDDNSYKP